ncbi:hypothetical protein MKW98_021159 [Papaver atlanticum]|uniref:RING-type domain-containing protein n=1 Tax=Papaver atlanticum TaxID=357466 RepID=A0AAD4XT15_9MAGN|nr:hypothetical protein MKW98_021159 [Papaver atlanticum]
MSARNPKVPNFIVLMCYILSIIKIFINFFLQILGFGKFTDTEEVMYPQTESDQLVVASANLIIEALPALKFEELILAGKINVHDQDSCAICLCEYEGGDEIKPLVNCSHIFHGSCLDRWMIHNQTTCPLCRTSLTPIQIEKDFFEESYLNVPSLEIYINPESFR